MDIITAVKSGRPYKRSHMKTYITFDTDDSFSGEDILATDWETEEPKVEITESEFWNVVKEQLCEEFTKRNYVYYGPQDELQQTLIGNIAKVLFGKKDEQQEDK